MTSAWFPVFIFPASERAQVHLTSPGADLIVQDTTALTTLLQSAGHARPEAILILYRRVPS